MRLWHYKLIPYLPKEMLVSQWRECIAIKRQWEKGTLKHRLVSYVMNQPDTEIMSGKQYFASYVSDIRYELERRGVKYNNKYFKEIMDFCDPTPYIGCNYIQHNKRYLKQCLYNLQEKADRGIVSKEDWRKIEDAFNRYL